MKGKTNASKPPVAEPIAVRATSYDLQKVRLVQVLIPLALIFFPLARRFQSAWLGLPAGALGIAIVRTMWAAQTRDKVLLRTFTDRVKVGSKTVRPGEFGQWRWHGRHATLFLPAGNVVIKPLAYAQADVLRSQLQRTLGAPLHYKHRGSLRARVAAAGVSALGLVLLAIGVVFQLVYMMPAVLVVIVGFAVFATLSQKVCDPTSLPTRKIE